MLFCGAFPFAELLSIQPPVETAEAETYKELNPNYSAFAHGATYSFTDYTTVATYIDTANDTGEDTKTVEVNRNADHGTELNPYVIDSTKTWDNFVDENSIVHASDSTYTFSYGKYFALAIDLDFADKTFTPIWAFSGTFYGLGHTLKNITFDYSEYNTLSNSASSAMGVFCNTYSGLKKTQVKDSKPCVIADLNIDNYKYTDAPFVTGGLIGSAYHYQSYAMNCHTNGTIKHTNKTGTQICWGGIFGTAQSAYAPTHDQYYVRAICTYRCSAKLTVELDDNSIAGASIVCFGGMVGGLWWGTAAYIYNCYAELDIDGNGGGTQACGSMIGLFPNAGINSQGGVLDIRECVGKVTYLLKGSGSVSGVTNVNKSLFAGVVPLVGIPDPDGDEKVYKYSNAKITLRNTYSSGNVNWLQNGVKYSCYLTPWIGNKADSSACLTTDSGLTNVYYSGDSVYATPTSVLTNTNLVANVSGANYVKEESELWNKARKTSVLKTKIWEKQSNIGTTYSIANSPVKNTEIDPVFKVEYYNLKKGSVGNEDEPITGVSNDTYTYNQKTSLTLASPSIIPTGRKFKGWTEDVTGNSAPVYSKNIVDVNGNLKFYAVWEVTDATATLETEGGVTQVEDGEVIRIKTKFSTPTIMNPVFSYTFLQDGKEVTSGTGADAQYVVSSSAQTGTYSLKFTVSDAAYPLVRYSGTSTNTLSLSLTQKSVRVRAGSFVVDSSTPAYKGAPLSTVKFTVVMEDGNGVEVSGTAAWANPDYPLQNGKNAVQIKFTPDNTSAYQPVTVNAEVEAVPLTLTFATSISDTKFVKEIVYKQPYAAKDIVEMFEAAYVEKIAADKSFELTVAGRTPKLDGIEIDSYNKPFEGATESKEIKVTFTDPKNYTVTLDYGYPDHPTETLTANWNHLVPEPETPYRGADYKFLGWFTTVNGTEEQWDFKTDRVTNDVTLTGKWKVISVTIQGIEVTTRSDPFTVTALTEVANLDITVTATYLSSESSEPITETVPFKVGNADGYTVLVDGKSTDKVHVGDASIKVSYKGKSQTVPMTVDPIVLDNSSIYFPPCTKEDNGTAQNMDDRFGLGDLPESLQKHVLSVKISYTLNGEPVTPKAQDTYTATATFTMLSKDYRLDPVSTYFIISAPRAEVTVSWNAAAEYIFNGVSQHPFATLTSLTISGDPDTQLSESQYVYTILNSSNSVSDGIGAGSYTVVVKLASSTLESRYKIRTGEDRKTYEIKKRKVDKPVATAQSFEYDGSVKNFALIGLEDYMSVTADSVQSATDAGTYTVTVRLGDNHEWKDGGVATYTWTIEKAKITKPTFGSVSVEYNGYEQSIAGELTAFDEAKMSITGDVQKDAGTYTARITPDANYMWSNNTTTPVNVKWTITKAKLNVYWEDVDTYEKNGTERFSPKVVGFDGLMGEDFFDVDADASLVRYDGANKSAVGSYIVKISDLRTDWAKNYEIEDLGKGYRIIAAGADPDSPDNPIVPDVTAPDPFNPDAGGSGSGSGTGSGNGSGGGVGDGTSDSTVSEVIPIILSGVSLVLIVTFVFMTLSYVSAAKQATQKAKGLAQVTYSFAPAGLLALGLSASDWWIVAGVLMACALVMGIVMFVFRDKKIKAFAVLDEERARLAAEKEAQAREEQRRDAQEEQRRRDNEFRMMFAAMQNNQQPQPVQPQLQLGDIQNLITSTVSALLPARQQNLLPPAPQAHPEDELRAQMAQQQQLLNQLLQNQQAQAHPEDELRAQMAQQQELLNQLLQNQQAQAQQVYFAPQRYADEIYEEYPNPFAISENPAVSLEESYGNLDDARKRYYYEIGAFIMDRPNVTQNDGKYAVLFKYRGRTIFKLTIRDDAPVLTYVENGVLVDQRVATDDDLEYAKQIMNRCFLLVDRGY